MSQLRIVQRFLKDSIMRLCGKGKGVLTLEEGRYASYHSPRRML